MKIHLNDRTYYFSKEVIDTLSKFRQTRSGTHEAGGILLGQVSKDCTYVCRVSIPNDLDKRSLFSFKRSKKSAQLIAEYEFHNSGGTITYLGEWHSHPEDIASPSSQDQRMIE